MIRQYRIKELEGVFTIEGSFNKRGSKSILKRRTAIEHFRRLNIHNEPIGAKNYPAHCMPPPLPPFTSLELAKRYFYTHIDKTAVKPEPIYHNLGKPETTNSTVKL